MIFHGVASCIPHSVVFMLMRGLWFSPPVETVFVCGKQLLSSVEASCRWCCHKPQWIRMNNVQCTTNLYLNITLQPLSTLATTFLFTPRFEDPLGVHSYSFHGNSGCLNSQTATHPHVKCRWSRVLTLANRVANRPPNKPLAEALALAICPYVTYLQRFKTVHVYLISGVLSPYLAFILSSSACFLAWSTFLNALFGW